MNNLVALVRREWLQHRFAWTLLMLAPLVLALLPLTFGHIEIGGALEEHGAPEMAAMLGVLSIVVSTAVVFVLLGLTALIIVSGLPRRDHGDRSIEFWLSLPIGHAESLAVPVLVHLILVPAAALLVGMLSGYAVSLVTVSRLVGFGEWLALPWGAIVSGSLSMVARVMAGLPLALLWLSPLVLLAMLANALFRRWGLPVLAVGLVLGSTVMERIFGQPMLSEALTHLIVNAARALAGASGQGVAFDEGSDPLVTLQAMPAWALKDFGAALGQAASPALLGALVVAAALFAALVVWRQRGAGAAG